MNAIHKQLATFIAVLIFIMVTVTNHAISAECSSCTQVILETKTGSSSKTKFGIDEYRDPALSPLGAGDIHHKYLFETLTEDDNDECTTPDDYYAGTHSVRTTNKWDFITEEYSHLEVTHDTGDFLLTAWVLDGVPQHGNPDCITFTDRGPQWTATSYYAGDYDIIISQYMGNGYSGDNYVKSKWELSDEYTTVRLTDRVTSEVSATLSTAEFDPSGSASGKVSITPPQLIASMEKTQYRFRIPQTRTDSLYRLSWIVDVTMEVDNGTNQVKTPTNEQHSLTFTGTGGEFIYEPSPLGATFYGGGVTRSELVNAQTICLEEFPIHIAGGSGGGGGCGCMLAAAPPPGSASRAPGIDQGAVFGASLGNNDSGFMVGALSFNSSAPALVSPGSLQLDVDTAGVTTVSPGGIISQIKASQVLVDIVTNSPTQFDVNFYDTNNFSTTLSGGRYPFTTNGQFVTWRIENPGGTGDTNHLQITEIRDGHGITNLFTWTNSGTTLSLVSGNGLKKEVWSYTYDNDGTTRFETIETRYTNNTLVSIRTDTYQLGATGDLLTQRVEGAGGDSRTNIYTYDAYGRRNGVNYWDGSTETTTYDSLGRISQTTRGLYSTSYDYTPLGGGDDGSFEPYVARTVSDYYNNGIIGIHYSVMTATNSIEVRASNTDPWYNSAHLFTTNSYDANRRLVRSVNPDKTAQWFQYSITPTSRVDTVYTGYITAGGTSVTNITAVNSYGLNGRLLSATTMEDGILMGSIAYTNYDNLSRVGRIVYFDGTSEGFAYDCCGLQMKTNRDGTFISYVKDDLKRLASQTENGMSLIFNRDPAGSLLSTVRQGTNGSTMTLNAATFDTRGAKVTMTDAMGNTNTLSESVNGSGNLLKTTTYADGATRIEKYDWSKELLSITGTAVHGVRYDHYASGSGDSYVQETKLDANGDNTSEWTITYTDMLGRTFKTEFAPYSVQALNYFNSRGQLTNSIDPDGVSTLYTYNSKGERALAVLDMDRDYVIDYAGSDRITFVTNDIVSDHGVNVRRQRSFAWTTSGGASNLISVSEQSVDGLQSWNSRVNGSQYVTSSSTTTWDAGGGTQTRTNASPDDSYVVMIYVRGQLASKTQYDSLGVQLGRSVYGYDAHGRQNSVTDARNGTTTSYFNNADQLSGVLTPSPGAGQSAQFSTNYFDNRGRIWRTTLPDNTSITNEYYFTGETKRTFGSRTYPVGYGFDYAGRMTTMTNWSDFSTGSGARVTKWTYDAGRGFLVSKTYDGDVSGPSYTYTDAGRLHTRVWARGITTTYSYNNAGELSEVDYDDGATASLVYDYDRLGRRNSVTQDTSVCSLVYDDQGDLLSEKYTAGPMNGLSITNGYDTLLRRTSLVTLNGTTVLSMTTNNYDAASRVSTVSDRTNSATYSYLANSPLVEQIVFKQSGTTRMTTTKTYDYLNQLTSISSSNASSVILDSHAYAYNDANQRIAVTNEDHTRWFYQYDALGQVTSGKKYWSDNGVIPGEQFGYTFDDIGNRTGTTGGGDEYGESLRSAIYGANSLNQYTNRTVPSAIDVFGTAATNATVTVNLQPTYRHGDFYRAEVPITNTSTAAWQSISNVAVLNNGTNSDTIAMTAGNVFFPKTPESFTYDDDGNLKTDGRWTYDWDAENRLIKLTCLTNIPTAAKLRLTFDYDWKGRRIMKSVESFNGTSWSTTLSNRFVYDGWNLATELNTTNNLPIRTYVWGLDLTGSLREAGGVGGLIVESFRGATATNGFVLYDGNGNITTLADSSSGSVIAKYQYGPFGEVIRATGPTANVNPFRFSTKYQDDESDLIYYGYRYYRPSIGLWLSRDPAGELGGDCNIYAFVKNKPIAWYDKLGLEGFPAEAPPPDDACGTGWEEVPSAKVWTFAGLHDYCNCSRYDWLGPFGTYLNLLESGPCHFRCLYTEIKVWKCSATGAIRSTVGKKTVPGHCTPYA